MTSPLNKNRSVALHHRVSQQPNFQYFNFLTLIILILNFLILFFFSCSSPTKSEGITISGRVVLEDTTDYSGVTVSLYKPVELDTALVRINQEYPNIGVQISQETEFDHREHTPVYTTTTDKNGNWKIENVTPGTYNVVAEKEGWGWEYVLEHNGETVGQITLKPLVVLEGTITENVNLTDETIWIRNDIYVPRGIVFLIINCTVLIDEGVSITINGEFNSQANSQNWNKIFPMDINKQWKLIEFQHGSGVILKRTIIKGASQGIVNKVHNPSIFESIFRNNYVGIYNFNIDYSISFNNNLFCFNEIGLESSIVRDNRIYNNLFYKNNIGLKVVSSQDVNDYNSSVYISRNVFRENVYDIFINHPFATNYIATSGIIEYNEFKNSQISIRMGRNGIVEGSNNNFINIEQYFVQLTAPNNKDTLNYQNNYWGYVDIIAIKDKIWDAEDDPTRSFVDVRNFNVTKHKLND
ncbi:hypothetical protein [Lutibacter sp.]